MNETNFPIQNEESKEENKKGKDNKPPQADNSSNNSKEQNKKINENANVDVNSTTHKMRPNSGNGLMNEGTVTSYEDENRNS